MHKRLFSLAMVGILLVAAVVLACVTPNQIGGFWDPQVHMYIAVDASIANIPAGSSTTPHDQIVAAVNAWKNVLQAIGSPVQLDLGDSPLANVVVAAGDLGTGGVGASQPRPTTNMAETRITFNNNPSNVIPGTNYPLVDTNTAGYQTVFYKMMLHEIGHILGLDEVLLGCSSPGASVVNKICNTNDIGSGIPLSITTCDSQQVSSVYSPPPPPGGEDGCTDPGTCAADDMWIPQYCMCWPRSNSPILFNLGEGSYELTGPETGVWFDIAAKGFPIRIGWTAPQEPLAFLALDLNGDGLISDGSELFGNHTRVGLTRALNGFEALAGYDSPIQGGNNDGWIDEDDGVFSRLKLWLDANHDGISQPTEILLPRQVGISRISVAAEPEMRRDKYGNLFKLRSSFILKGKPRLAYDVYFATGGVTLRGESRACPVSLVTTNRLPTP